MTNSNWKEGETTVAIAEVEGKWQYLRFSNWADARAAVNKAREEGKAAVFYDGATLPEPPESPMSAEPGKD